MKIQIKHRISLDVLFECEADSMKIAVKLAVENNADLSSADLSYADLSSADLRSADLMLFRFNRDEAFFQFDGKIRIGCIYETVEWWLANYSEVGARESYSATEILAYGNFIRLCDELQKGKVK